MAASAVNCCVLADRLRAAPATQLALAALSFAAVTSVVTAFALKERPDAIICWVGCWALTGA